MGWLAIAAPYIAQGAGVLASYFGSKKAGKRNPEESAALTGAQTSATNLASTGQNLLSTVEGPRDYWSTLLKGNRAQQSQLVAPQRGAITDTYRGAERAIDRSGIQGAERDVTMGELIRERAAKIAGLTSGVQPMAAQQLQQIAGMGGPLLEASGSLWGNLLGQATQNRQNADVQKGKAGQVAGQYLFDLASGISSKYGNRGLTVGGTTTGGTFDPSAG